MALVTFVLATGLTLNGYGIYAFTTRLILIVVGVAALGTGPSLLRYIPAYNDDPDRQNRVLGLAYGTALGGGLSLTLAVIVLAPQINRWTLEQPLFTTVLQIYAVSILVIALSMVTVFAFRSRKMITWSTFLSNVLPDLLQVGAAVLVIALGYAVRGVAVAFVISAVVTLAIALGLLFRHTELRPALPLSKQEAREFFTFALPLAAGKLGNVLRSRLDVLLVGTLLSAGSAAIYNVAFTLTGFIPLLLIGFNQLFPPIASELYEADQYTELNAVYSTVTRWVLTGTLALATIEFVYRIQLLSLFGSEYTRGSLVLVLFVVAQTVNGAVGPAGWLLSMTDHQYVHAATDWGLGVLNLGLSVYFIVEFGLIGAAVGTASSLAIINVLSVGALWYLEGLFPYTTAFLKPIGASVGMGLLMTGLERVVPESVLLLVGIPADIVTFILLLSLFGIEHQDRQLFGSFLVEN